MKKVEDCLNWKECNPVRGKHCYNCGMRNGYPYRGQPDKRCSNFSILDLDSIISESKKEER